MLQADVQGGFLVWAIFWREPASKHHHREGPLWRGNAPTGFPDQAAYDSHTPVAWRGILCAQSAQQHQLWDQEQRRAHSEELQFGCWGKCITRTSWVKVSDFLSIFGKYPGMNKKKCSMQECQVQNTAREYIKAYTTAAQSIESFGAIPE